MVSEIFSPDIQRNPRDFFFIFIRVNMLNTKEFPEKVGRIYPPIVSIEYGEITSKEMEEGTEVNFEFSVTYEMEMRETRKDIEVRYACTLQQGFASFSNSES